jgi:hypothetical protein
MSDRIEPRGRAGNELERVTKVLVAQAFALDDMFYRAAKEAFSTDDTSYYYARKALKAQARCRATLKVLLALRKGAAAKKIPNLNGGTIQNLKTIFPANSLTRQEKVPAPGAVRRPKRRTLRSNRWTPERRARQAVAIRNWQPWRTSTGPRTEAGKARSTGNALKHGLRSKATIEARRVDRLILACAARNLRTAKSFFGTISDKCERPDPGLFHSIDIGRGTPALIPSRPRITRESPPGGTPPPVTTAIPRRGWRIAS